MRRVPAAKIELVFRHGVPESFRQALTHQVVALAADNQELVTAPNERACLTYDRRA